ncbi:alpha/beta fold hydrolase [Pseudofrankia saprophytica]|nr:alpha/beta hydrolase [Pseudofrankia saprophytica]
MTNMPPAADRTVDHDDLGVDAGPGEPALLYLSGLGSPRSMWRPLAGTTAFWRRSVAVDWRRHGTNPPGPHDYEWDDLLADAVGVVDALGVGTFVPVANAHAGWVALELARRFPDRVPGVVLVDWMVLGPPAPFLGGLAAMRDPARWEAAVAALTASWVHGHEDVPGLVDLVEGMRANGFSTWSRAGELISGAFARHGSPLAAFGRLHPPVPTLHLYGDPADEGYLVAQQVYAQSNPWFHVRRLEGARSHFPMLEAPGEIAASVEDFIRTCVLAPAAG